jgi:hypothetical protein
MRGGFNVEGFANLSELIDQASALSDMELKTYLSSLSASQQADFVANNINQAVSNVTAAKQLRFNEASAQMVAADNSVVGAAYYLARTSDLNHLANDIDQVAAKQAATAQLNGELAGRQYEVNEWANSNKLDSLFFLQVLFICLTLLGTLYFLTLNGLLPQYLFGLFTFIIFISAVAVLIFRARFTNVARDSRYWSKQRFPSSTSVSGSFDASGLRNAIAGSIATSGTCNNNAPQSPPKV